MEVSTGWWTIFVQPNGAVTPTTVPAVTSTSATISAVTTSVTAVTPTTVASTAAAPLFSVTPMGCPAGNFNCNAVSQKITAIHFITGIVSIPVVVKFHKAEPILL